MKIQEQLKTALAAKEAAEQDRDMYKRELDALIPRFQAAQQTIGQLREAIRLYGDLDKCLSEISDFANSHLAECGLCSDPHNDDCTCGFEAACKKELEIRNQLQSILARMKGE